MSIAELDCVPGWKRSSLPLDEGDESKEFTGCVEAAVQELAKKDFVYLHAGLVRRCAPCD